MHISTIKKLRKTTFSQGIAPYSSTLTSNSGPVSVFFVSGVVTGKERDPETGLYYYGARYLDPRTSRWLSVDPAMGEYIPLAPINDDAKKHNENLPGMGGVFNYVNFYVYHYGGNNPIKLVDPDGRSDEYVEQRIAEEAQRRQATENRSSNPRTEITIFRYDTSYNTTERRNDDQRGQDLLVLDNIDTGERFIIRVQTVANMEGTSGNTLSSGSFYTQFGDAGTESIFDPNVLTPVYAGITDGRSLDGTGLADGNWGRHRFHEGALISAGCIIGDIGSLAQTLEEWGVERGRYIFTRIIDVSR